MCQIKDFYWLIYLIKTFTETTLVTFTGVADTLFVFLKEKRMFEMCKALVNSISHLCFLPLFLTK